MRITGRNEKWGAGVLGVLSLALLVHLVFMYKSGSGGAASAGAKTSPRVDTSTPRGAPPVAGKEKTSDGLSRYDSLVKLDLLKELQDRPLPELHRDPFEFAGSRAPAPPVQTAAAAAAPAQPPPPPPVTLKPMGYSEGKGGIKEAMVSDDDQVFVVHEGDSVGTRYKIIKITSTLITVQDATIHQTVDLPVPP
jgi:hypothetical protein